MSENITNKSTREDEIDLLDLFRKMWNTINEWRRALGRGILTSIVFLFKWWLPLGISVVAGVLVSFLTKSITEPFFTADIILRTNVVPNADMIAYINRLHAFCKDENKDAISQVLSISSENVEKINDISAYWIIDQTKDGIPDYVDFNNEFNLNDTNNIRMRDRLNIRVITKSPESLEYLRDPIISFINRDSLFQVRNRLRIQQNKVLLSRLDYDILQLDSLQKVKYFEETRNRQPQNGGQMIFLQEQKTQLVYNDIYSLISRKQSIETENVLFKDIVTILRDFQLNIKRENGTLFYGIYIIPAFFLLTLIGLIIRLNWGVIMEIKRKY